MKFDTNWIKAHKRSNGVFRYMEPLSVILSLVPIANMGILGVLITIFGRMYNKTKAQLALGMIVVGVLLLSHNAICMLTYLSMSDVFAHDLFPYMFGIGITELAGLLVFLKITLD